MQKSDELARIRSEYARRGADTRLSQLYDPVSLPTLFIVQGRERALVDLLRSEKVRSLSDMRLLDIGCGTGGELGRFLAYGAQVRNLYGIDLLDDRIRTAWHIAPQLNLAQANAAQLPFKDAWFDIVLQFTVFSSILDTLLKRQVAAEMLRVLKPNGFIIWYDFWLNPTNRATRGIRANEIRQLFDGCQFKFRRVTLAPPISRRVVPRSWLVGHLLESLPFLRTHYLVKISKNFRGRDA